MKNQTLLTSTAHQSGNITRLVVSILGVYASFIVWGLLQERLSSTNYMSVIEAKSQLNESEVIAEAKWTHVAVLNFCLAFSCAAIASPFVFYSGAQLAPQNGLVPAALSNSLASPFGYVSLQYISYPMLLLVKSSKLVPVMLASYLINGKIYDKFQILSAFLISAGVALFSCKINPMSLFKVEEVPYESSESYDKVAENGVKNTMIGLLLVLVNLMLDGFTNARQDKFKKDEPNISSFSMMYQMNILQVIILGLFLLIEFVISGNEHLSSIFGLASSQLQEAFHFITQHPIVIKDIALFCICGATGQVFLFYIITEFGTLICVLITVTRKFFSILLSVVMFGHNVQSWQWIGIGFVFVGLISNAVDKFLSRKNLKVKVT